MLARGMDYLDIKDINIANINFFFNFTTPRVAYCVYRTYDWTLNLIMSISPLFMSVLLCQFLLKQTRLRSTLKNYIKCYQFVVAIRDESV